MSHPVYNLAQDLFGEDARRISFQEDVYDALRAGQNVVLQAPTGSGKTFAALAPLVLGAWGKETGPPARKLIYSLPLRVLAGSLKSDYEALLGALDVPLNFTTQFGGEAHDAFLDGGDDYWTPRNGNVRPGTRHAVFTTIDQTLSGFAGIPVSLPYRLANVPYGSILSGALVFDEFHLLDPDRSFQTALHLLRQSPWPVLIMTATLSGFMRKALEDTLDAEVITVGSEDVKECRDDKPLIPSQYKTVKTLHVKSSPMKGTKVADDLGDRTLVICNQVKRAQTVYEDLCEALDARGDDRERLLLHSRYLPDDRAAKEADVRKWFEKGSTTRAVVVATQVMEAGLDVSADVMHTEACPIDSFLQRIGRTARYTAKHADIYVYPVHSTLPYDEDVTEQTLSSLRSQTNQALRFGDLQGLINEVMTETHQSIMTAFRSGFRRRATTLRKARNNQDRGELSNLIRDIDNVEIVVARRKDVSAEGQSPFEYPAVSVPRSTFENFLRDVEEGVYVADSEGKEAQEDDQSSSFQLKDATSMPVKQWPSRRFVVSPRLARYDDKGLSLGDKGERVFAPDNPGVQSWGSYTYERETYAKHIERVRDRKEIRAGTVDAIRRLSESESHPEIKVHNPEWVFLCMIWGHDIVKLAEGWQSSCGSPDAPLGHGERIEGKSPHSHAAESAWAAGPVIYEVLSQAGEENQTVFAVLKAICTHHGPRASSSLAPYRIPDSYKAYLKEQTPPLLKDNASLVLDAWPEMEWTHSGGDVTWPRVRTDVSPLYYLLVYALRRSDQMATSLASRPKAASSSS